MGGLRKETGATIGHRRELECFRAKLKPAQLERRPGKQVFEQSVKGFRGLAEMPQVFVHLLRRHIMDFPAEDISQVDDSGKGISKIVGDDGK